MSTVQNARDELRIWRMIPAKRTTTANGTSQSARTYGSGGAGTRVGVVDTQGAHTAIIRCFKQTGTAMKFSFRLYQQCRASYLVTGGISVASVFFCGSTASGMMREYRINCRNLTKRYLNCKVVTCTTSGNAEVQCVLISNRQWPTATPTGYTVVSIA